MTYDELIEKLKKGKKVRKKTWMKGEYIYFDSDEYKCYTENGIPAKIEWLIKSLADEWEDIADTVPIKELVGKRIRYYGVDYYISPPVTQLKKTGDKAIVYCLIPTYLTHSIITLQSLPENYLVPEDWIVK